VAAEARACGGRGAESPIGYPPTALTGRYLGDVDARVAI